MIVAFTICTISYLPRALVLVNSLRAVQPTWKLIIGLVDVLPQSLDFPLPHYVELVPVEELEIRNFPLMNDRYNIIELCTSVKPSYFRYIFASDDSIAQVHYFDPDIFVYNNLDTLTHDDPAADIILTPHILSEIPLDGHFPAENLFLNHGIYNLGYLGLRRSISVMHLLDWWEARMEEYCKIDLRQGYFVDQLYFNLIPLYFHTTFVCKNPGANVAYWNFHERTIIEGHRILFKGDVYPLLFFHFSGFSTETPHRVTRTDVRVNENSQVGLALLLDHYSAQLIQCGHQRLRHIKPRYGDNAQVKYTKDSVLQKSRAKLKVLRKYLQRVG